MKNLKEFKALIERYESITKEEIEGCKCYTYDHTRLYAYDIMNELTGFGGTDTCSLCLAVEHDCYLCVYGNDLKCIEDSTYDRIIDAFDTDCLLQALRNRANYMKTLLPKE